MSARDSMDFARKLKALAERGEAGEAEAARAALERLAEKYTIDLEALDDTAETIHEYRYRTELELKLLLQVCNQVDPDMQCGTYKRRYSRKRVGVAFCSERKGAEIAARYEFYRTLLAEELETFFLAFVYKHTIFTPSDTGKSPSREELRRIHMLQLGMRDRQFHPALEAYGGDGDGL